MRLTTCVVGPLMLLEAVTAVWMLLDRPAGVAPEIAWTGVGLVASIWPATGLLAVPRHEALREGLDACAPLRPERRHRRWEPCTSPVRKKM